MLVLPPPPTHTLKFSTHSEAAMGDFSTEPARDFHTEGLEAPGSGGEKGGLKGGCFAYRGQGGGTDD